MKTIGILGGMGPLATVDLFRKIVILTDADSDNAHIPIIIDNNTQIPDRTDYIIKKGKDPTNYLIRSALRLEMMGADVIVMPCNTAHYFYNEIVKHIKIPFINMIVETAKEIKKIYPDITKVGLLATEGTYKSGIYDKIFSDYDLELVKPDDNDQRFVTELIYSIKKGNYDINLTNFKKVLNKIKKQNINAFVLGCTELPIAFQMFNIDEIYIDPTKILACSAIKYVGKNVKNT